MKTPVNKQIQRVKRLKERQPCSSWEPDYQPATHANRQEAPSRSSPTIFRGKVKLDRDLHALSSTETAAMLAALYEKSVVDIHEQKVLRLLESPNPIVNHPLAKGRAPSNLPGMLRAFDRLDARDLYPTIKRKGEDTVPNLLEGDLLLYVFGDTGLRCVNWTVKRSSEQFESTSLDGVVSLQTSRQKEKAYIRHAAEELYYLEAGIPTHRITDETFPKVYIANLRDCYCGRAGLSKPLSRHLGAAALLLKNSMGTGDTPADIARYYCSKHRIPISDWVTLCYSAVWERKVSVDMFRPLLLDRPLRQELLTENKFAGLFMEDEACR